MFKQVLEKRIAVEEEVTRFTKSGESVQLYATVFPYELRSELSIAAVVRNM